jgi:hypothetical protein
LLAWWQRLRPRLAWPGGRELPAPPAASYRIPCACGQTVTGLRQARFQVVPCPACRARLFVLPRSPLPRVPGAPVEDIPPAPATAGPPRRRRRAAGAVGLAVLAGLAAVPVAWWVRSSAPASVETERSAAPAEPARPRLARAELLLARGQFHQALAEVDVAVGLAAGESPGLSPRDRRRLRQVRRQAALLADLSAESLEEILRHRAGLSDPEWEATFRRRYQGKGLVLDTDVARTAAGRYRHGWRVLLPDGQARLELDGLKVLDGLPLQEPQRLVFGARLHSARREPPGAWVIHLVPDSGVLLTDPQAAALCCAGLADEDARQVLRRQRGWVLDGGPERAVATKE